MDLAQLITELRNRGNQLYTWYGVDTNVESVSELLGENGKFRVELKLKQEPIDEDELRSILPSRNEIQDYLDDNGYLDDDGNFIDFVERAVQIGFEMGYRAANQE